MAPSNPALARDHVQQQGCYKHSECRCNDRTKDDVKFHEAGYESLLGQNTLKTDNDLHVITDGALVDTVLDAKVAALDQ